MCFCRLMRGKQRDTILSIALISTSVRIKLLIVVQNNLDVLIALQVRGYVPMFDVMVVLREDTCKIVFTGREKCVGLMIMCFGAQRANSLVHCQAANCMQ